MEDHEKVSARHPFRYFGHRPVRVPALDRCIGSPCSNRFNRGFGSIRPCQRSARRELERGNLRVCHCIKPAGCGHRWSLVLGDSIWRRPGSVRHPDDDRRRRLRTGSALEIAKQNQLEQRRARGLVRRGQQTRPGMDVFQCAGLGPARRGYFRDTAQWRYLWRQGAGERDRGCVSQWHGDRFARRQRLDLRDQRRLRRCMVHQRGECIAR